MGANVFDNAETASHFVVKEALEGGGNTPNRRYCSWQGHAHTLAAHKSQVPFPQTLFMWHIYSKDGSNEPMKRSGWVQLEHPHTMHYYWEGPVPVSAHTA